MTQFEKRCMGCMSAIVNDDAACHNCGWINGTQPASPQHLVPGTVLHEKYLVGRVLGQGGFGITYLGWDLQLDMKLAIKEYMPRDFATRNNGEAEVTFFSGNVKTDFVNGMNKFLEEAKILAKYNNQPGIVSVRDFFRENGTAYLVMYYLDGVDLKKYVEQFGGRLSYEQALAIMMPVMEALAVVHKDGILHRDISPDNIYITMTGEVKLLDFGAARHALNNSNKSLSVILKPGYAPEEQYRTRGNQGPWTDIYGLGATFYRVLTGNVPPESLDRGEEDTLIPPGQLGISIPPHAEAAILKALEIKAGSRFQSMEAFQGALLHPGQQQITSPPPETRGSELGNTISVSQREYATNLSIGKKKKVGLIIGASICGTVLLFIIGLIAIGAMFSNDDVITPVNNGPVVNGGSNNDVPKVDNSVQVTVPRIYNLTEEQAEIELQKAGLTVGNVSYEENIIAKKGRVIDQSPAPDTKLGKNSAIDLFVSTGVELPVDNDTIYSEQMTIVNQYWDEAGLLYSNSQLEEALKKYIQTREMAGILYAHNQSEEARLAEGYIANLMATIKSQLQFHDYALEDSLESVEMISGMNNPNYNDYLSEAYGNLSWHQTLVNQVEEAIASAQQALALNPNNVVNKVNLAHGYLLTGDFGEAFRLYREVMNQEVGGQLLAVTIAEDFVAIEQAGITHPNIKEINEIVLGNMPDNSDEAAIERTIYFQAYSEIAEDLDGYMSVVSFSPGSEQYEQLYASYDNFFNSVEMEDVKVTSYTVQELTAATAVVAVTKQYTYADASGERIEEEVSYDITLVKGGGRVFSWLINQVVMK